MRAALLCALSLSTPALADGPALAHLTMGGTTLTLTATTDLPEDARTMTFAQMHLGFPLPPVLTITLDDGPVLQGVSLNATSEGASSTGAGTPLGPEARLLFEMDQAHVETPDATRLRITAPLWVRSPLGQFRSTEVLIEIDRTSP